MVITSQKTLSIRQKLISFILAPKRGIFLGICAIVFTTFLLVNMDVDRVSAATGINPTVNFQGKVVNSDGTNVADGEYTFVFNIYDAPSGGANPWTETQNNVVVTAGIFRVSLGSVQSLSGVNFNTDNLYLGINFNSDGEMTPRIRFASVPYAFNAQKVAGLTVTDTTGTLTIPNGEVIQFGGSFTTSAQDLTLTLSGSTNVTLPTTGTLATLGGVENLSNKSFTSTVSFSGITQDITTGIDEALVLVPNGTGNVLISTQGGGQSALIIDKTGLGDIFSASSSGVTKFTVKSDGNASSSAGFTVNGVGSLQSTLNQTLTIGGNSTGDIQFRPGDSSTSLYLASNGAIGVGGSYGDSQNCLVSNGNSSSASWGDCQTGSGGNYWNLNAASGTIYPINTTLNLLFGGSSTASARFQLFGNINSGTTPVASISANSSFAGVIIDQLGSGDFLTASSSGVTKFTITKAGGISASDGITVDKTGSNDIVKTTSGNDQKDTDFLRTANSTTANLTNIDNSGGELTLDKGTVTSNGTITTSSQPTLPAALGAGSSSITRQNGQYLVIRGGVTTTMYVYDSLAGNFSTAPIVANANVGAGSVAIPRPDGKYLLVHGNGVATTSIIDPSGNVPTVAGPTATGTNNTGTNIYRRQNGQYLLIHGGAAGTSRVYNPVANTFAAGPTAGATTWAAGSLILPRQNGTALIVAGGATANTQVYNLDGAAGIGSFTVGPVLPTNCEINGAGSVALQLANGRYIILSKANVSVEYDPVNNTMGTCQAVGPPAALADGAHAIRLQDRRFLIFRGSGTTNAYIYDPSTNTYSTHATSTSTQGAGLHSLQKHNGTWMVLVGGSTTTNQYDSQLIMNGSYQSEDITTQSLNPSSSFWFTAGAESLFTGTSSATVVGDLPQSGLEISIRTSSSQGGLATATEKRIYRNGDPIRAGADEKWIRVYINFTRPIPQQIYDERKTWVGNGMTNIIRDYNDPTIYDYLIDNSTVLVRNNFDFLDSQGVLDPTEASASALTRVQALADRITLPWGKVPGPTQVSTNNGFYTGSIGLHQPLLAPTADGTLVIQRPGGLISIIATGSANMTMYDPASARFTAQSGAGNIPTASAGRGAFALKLPNGKFFIVFGNNTATTNIYDPNAASGSQFVQGPNLAGLAGFGAQPLLNKDGTYTILHGNGLQTSTFFNPYTDPIKPSSVTLPVGPLTTTAINCGSWAIPLAGQMQDTYRVFAGVAPFATGVTTSMMYDSVAKQFLAGPALTGNHGCGSHAFQRQDGYWVTVAAAGGTTGAQSAATSIINPWSNTNIVGPTLTSAVGRGSLVIPRADGTFLITRGQTQTINGNGTNIYFPWGGTFGVGAGIGTSVAGPNMIDSSGTPGTTVSGTGALAFQRPDGKWVILAGGHIGSATVNLYDAGWYPDGQYQSGQIYAPTITTNSTMSWKKSTDDFVDFQVRSSPTREALLTSSFDSVSRSGDTIAANSGDSWIQVQINFSRRFLGYSGMYSDVWKSGGALPSLVVQQPTVFEYRVNNAYDFLTLKNDGLNMFRVNKYGAVYSGIQGGFYTGGADLAENYSSKQILAKGEVVSIDGLSGDHNIKRSEGQYDSKLLGVVSTNPGFVAGDGTEDSYPIALVGRVPVKVSTENGAINEGDALTSASIPGYAMKATVGGRVLGRALQSFDESTSTECPAIAMGSLPTTKCGTVMLFVNLVDFSGESLNVALEGSGFKMLHQALPMIAGVDFVNDTEAYRQQEILAFLREQNDYGQGIYTNSIAATKEVISPKIITDLLVARKIKAESIEGLEILTNSIDSLASRVATGSSNVNFLETLTSLSAGQKNLESTMASLSARLSDLGSVNLLGLASSITKGEFLTSVESLAVYGSTTLSDASVLGELTIGSGSTMNIGGHNIDTIGEDLKIQGLRQGAITFLDSAIRFEIDGRAIFSEDSHFKKNVIVAGVLSASTIAATDLLLGNGEAKILSDVEVESTAAAGLVTIKKDKDHVKIINPLVRRGSYIFITPKSATSRTLYLLEQNESENENKGFFTVGIDREATDDIKFNYLIVN